jgi:pimeloyl-ACP methyl ester carboxylesterase
MTNIDLAADLAGTWLRATPAIELIRIAQEGAGYTASIDRPAAMRFREPIRVITAMADSAPGDGLDRVEVADGRAVLVGGDGTRTPLLRVTPPRSEEFGKWCGWYEADGRSVLLAQFPEEYFGDPMYLIGDGDVVERAYPLSERRFARQDGLEIELQADGERGPLALRLGTLTLPRTDRYREQEVTFAAGDITLSGTLIVPAGPGPHPAAVVAHGAAGGQRDFCRLFAQAPLDAGVAVLIYDKQGHGRSAGAAEPTIFDQANALSAALDLLASTPGLDPGRLGLLGFSNGMWAVPIAAARRPNVAFVAGVGSPGVTMAESEVHRRTKVLRDAGVGAETLAAVAAAWRCLFGIAATAQASPQLTSHLEALLKQLSAAPDLHRYETPEFARTNPMLAPSPPSGPAADLVAMVSGEPHPELAYDPADDYRRLRCPVFLQYGSQDTSVPAATSAERIADALRESGGPGATIHVYPNLEHQLNVVPAAPAGIAAEEASYLFHDFRFGAGVMTDLTSWLRRTLASGSRQQGQQS